MGTIGIVTDSTCDLGPEWLSSHGILMVPLIVRFGDETYRDWCDLAPEEFYRMLAASPILPKTSQPAPAEFEAVYEGLAAAGCDGIVSIHLSSMLSGTIASATIAAAASPIPVRVVDSKSASQGTGLVVKAAAAARDAGGLLDDVAAAAETAVPGVHLFFVVESLEYLVKGGRAGKAQALAATMLNIKPVLHIDAEGVIEPFKKVKGMQKAIEEIASQVARDSKAGGRMRVALLHGVRPDLADKMREALAASGADYEIESDGLVGAVIGTYTGSGVVGVAYHPAG
jgi:DegV family protein with EDD domain